MIFVIARDGEEGTQVLNKTVHLFEPPDGYQVVYQDPAGILFPGNAMFLGENRQMVPFNLCD